MTCLSAICLTQAWMMWKFINFQLKKWREQSQVQSSKKKTVSPKSKPGKKDSSRGESAPKSSTRINPIPSSVDADQNQSCMLVKV